MGRFWRCNDQSAIFLLEPNEAYITGDFTKDMIRFIKAHKLGKVLDETAKSGYGTYQKVAFDLARLAEFDPEGVAEHCKMMGIELPKRETKESEKAKTEERSDKLWKSR